MNQGRADDKNTQPCTNANLDIFRDQLHYLFPNLKQAQHQEQYSRNHGHAKTHLPVSQSRHYDRISKHNAGRNPGSQSNRHVGRHPHQHGDKRGNQRCGNQYTHCVHPRIPHVYRLQDNDVGHGGKGGHPGQHLSPDAGPPLPDFKMFFQCVHSFLLCIFII